MNLTKSKLILTRFVFILTVAMILGCGANENILKSGRETSKEPPLRSVPDSLEKDVAAIKDVGFRWIYIYRRKDGGELDLDDKAFLRQHADQANRKVLTDEGKAVLVGSNYFLGYKEVSALSERFDVTDMSPPGESLLTNK